MKNQQELFTDATKLCKKLGKGSLYFTAIVVDVQAIEKYFVAWPFIQY